MKKTLTLVLVVLLCASLMFASGFARADEGADAADYSVVCILNGNLGDKSFFDSANAGMQLIADELGVETKVVEVGFDNTKWEPALLEASEQDWDLIVVGTWQMQEILETIAPQFPDKKYVIFDSEVAADNVYSITYKQNDGSYLAGVAAAGFTTSGFEGTNEDNLIGAVCGVDVPVINDFVVGYIQGATDAYPDVKVTTAYVGDFNDTAKAKELAMTQYTAGADIVFNVSAQAGLGIFDAAKDKGGFAIGVDADQSATFTETDPDKEALIITSMLKNIDVSLLRAVQLDLEGNLPLGQTEALGIAEGAVGLAKNDVYLNTVPQDIQDKVDQAEADIKDGKVTVMSAFDMSTDDLVEFKNAVAP